MADYYLQNNIKQSFSLSDIDSNMEFMSNFPEINQETSALNFQNFMGFSDDNIFPQLIPECATISDDFPGLFIHEEKNLVPQISNDLHESSKRKEIDTPQSSGANSSVQGSANVVTRKNSGGRGKKPKLIEKEDTPKDVVHVRAKRGQATDSHSLAERVRRGKINERLRCLQDIVPGCYKTMGMAVMLDEIINYVQSLQSQVEFLSMKLTAASTFYDFNAETDAFETMQQVKAHEALKMQKMAKEGCIEGIGSPQFSPLDLSFGNYPSWPRNI